MAGGLVSSTVTTVDMARRAAAGEGGIAIVIGGHRFGIAHAAASAAALIAAAAVAFLTG